MPVITQGDSTVARAIMYGAPSSSLSEMIRERIDRAVDMNGINNQMFINDIYQSFEQHHGESVLANIGRIIHKHDSHSVQDLVYEVECLQDLQTATGIMRWIVCMEKGVSHMMRRDLCMGYDESFCSLYKNTSSGLLDAIYDNIMFGTYYTTEEEYHERYFFLEEAERFIYKLGNNRDLVKQVWEKVRHYTTMGFDVTSPYGTRLT